MKLTGSLYLHCDPTASHYLKLLLDGIFGSDNFRNEIVWRRTNAKGLAFKNYPRNHDLLLYYFKGGDLIWNQPFRPHDPEYVAQFYRYVEPQNRASLSLGRPYEPKSEPSQLDLRVERA